MDRRSALEEVYNSALLDEFEKIAKKWGPGRRDIRSMEDDFDDPYKHLIPVKQKDVRKLIKQLKKDPKTKELIDKKYKTTGGTMYGGQRLVLKDKGVYSKVSPGKAFGMSMLLGVPGALGMRNLNYKATPEAVKKFGLREK